MKPDAWTWTMEEDDDAVRASAPAEAVEPVLDDGPRRRLLWLMAEYFHTLGYSDLKARLPGHVSPSVLAGTVEDLRPDCTCRQDDSARTPLLLEVVTAEDVAEPGSDSRWSLLASAAKLYGAELHFVVPRWTEQGSVDPALRRRLQALDVRPNRIWTV